MTNFTETTITQKYIRRYPNSKRTKSWAGKIVHIQTENSVWRVGSAGYTFAGRKDAMKLPFEEALEEVAHCGPEKRATFIYADHPIVDHEIAIDSFVDEVVKEVISAIAKFPQPNPNIAALAEEVGEAAQAALHIREGKSNDWWKVHNECVQVAAMACRLAIEGDPTVGAVPTAENCK